MLLRFGYDVLAFALAVESLMIRGAQSGFGAPVYYGEPDDDEPGAHGASEHGVGRPGGMAGFLTPRETGLVCAPPFIKS